MADFGLSKLFNKISDTVTEAQRTHRVKGWLDELSDAEKREKDYVSDGRRVQAIYEASRSETGRATTAFNILYANTELLAPALYNATPRPVVKRKTKKQEPVAIAAALVLQHFLIHQSDSGERDNATLDDLLEGAVLEALVPGRGVSRFSYDSEVEELPETELLEGDSGKKEPDESQAENPNAPAPIPQVKYECILGDQVPWDRIRFGYAKQWHKLPWLAFEHFLTRQECVDTFGEEKGSAIKLTHQPTEDKDGSKDRPADAAGVKFAHVWEIWDRNEKKVIFISDGSPDVIQEDDDPLQLDGFFPIPRPLIFLRRITSLVPNILYLMYEEQAMELNDITVRIGKITRALKVRGFYDSTLEGLEKLLSSPDNTLIPATNVAAMQQGQTLDKAIWMMPLGELVAVLQQLYLNRSQVQAVLQQLSGIADIMRGQGAASETLGAQEIKQNWGSLRMKKLQRLVAGYARECFRIMAELAANHFSQETFQQVTGLQFPTNMQKQQMTAHLQQMQQQMAMMQPPAGAPAPGAPPAPPPQPNPQQQAMQQQMQMGQAMMKMPSWEDILQFIKNDEMRNYVVSIQTNSTVDVEATEDKQQLSEFMNSFSQLMNGMLPMVQEGIMPFDAAKSIMLSIVQKFRLDDEVEEALRNMKQPEPKPDPVMQKVQGQLQIEKSKADATLQAQQQQQQLDQQAQRQQQAIDQQNMQAEAALKAQEMKIKQAELALKERELGMKEQYLVAKHARDMEMLTVKAAVAAQGESNAAV